MADPVKPDVLVLVIVAIHKWLLAVFAELHKYAVTVLNAIHTYLLLVVKIALVAAVVMFLTDIVIKTKFGIFQAVLDIIKAVGGISVGGALAIIGIGLLIGVGVAVYYEQRKGTPPPTGRV